MKHQTLFQRSQNVSWTLWMSDGRHNDDTFQWNIKLCFNVHKMFHGRYECRIDVIMTIRFNEISNFVSTFTKCFMDVMNVRWTSKWRYVAMKLCFNVTKCSMDVMNVRWTLKWWLCSDEISNSDEIAKCFDFHKTFHWCYRMDVKKMES